MPTISSQVMWVYQKYCSYFTRGIWFVSNKLVFEMMEVLSGVTWCGGGAVLSHAYSILIVVERLLNTALRWDDFRWISLYVKIAQSSHNTVILIGWFTGCRTDYDTLSDKERRNEDWDFRRVYCPCKKHTLALFAVILLLSLGSSWMQGC